jgi:DNA-binding transcriptional LysR family regulator
VADQIAQSRTGVAFGATPSPDGHGLRLDFTADKGEPELRRSAPPLQGLEAFIVAARSASFRAAADALALSPSALSRRIQGLEDAVGAQLFDRTGPTPVLTAAGEAYRREVEPAIEAIRAATVRLRAPPPAASLRVMASQSFAISWLMPRSPAFQDRTGTSLEMILGRDLAGLRLGRADVAVAHGPSDFEGLPFERLIPLEGAVVSAEVLAGGRAPPATPGELASHTLLGVQTPGDIWQRWLARAGLAEPAQTRPLVFETLTLMYEAAANGLGVALAIPTVADRYLQGGRLRACFDLRAGTGTDYNLVYASEAVRRRPDVRAFTEWVKAETERSAVSFVGLLDRSRAAPATLPAA